MHLLPMLALLEHAAAPIVDDVLRILGGAVIVWVFFRGIKSLLPKPAAPPQTAAAPPAATVAAPAPAAAITPEILAVIAAAVATAAGPDRRVVLIKSYSTHWARAGRQAVLTSHRIR